MSEVVHVTTKTEFYDHVDSNENVVVKFTAPAWCAPCRQFAPHFEEAAKQLPNITFVSVDIDDAPWASEVFNILSVPVVKQFIGGEVLRDIKSRAVVPLIKELRSTDERRT